MPYPCLPPISSSVAQFGFCCGKAIGFSGFSLILPFPASPRGRRLVIEPKNKSNVLYLGAFWIFPAVAKAISKPPFPAPRISDIKFLHQNDNLITVQPTRRVRV